MNAYLLYAIGGALLFGWGAYGLITREHLVHKVMSANFMGSGVFLVLIALGDRVPDGPPDPVPQAMVLTGIVVTVAMTALGLSIIKRYFTETGRVTLTDSDEESA